MWVFTLPTIIITELIISFDEWEFRGSRFLIVLTNEVSFHFWLIPGFFIFLNFVLFCRIEVILLRNFSSSRITNIEDLSTFLITVFVSYFNSCCNAEFRCEKRAAVTISCSVGFSGDFSV